MDTRKASMSTKLKVGIFALLGLLLIGAVTVFVNDRPFWWRQCQLVHISIDDATGLRTKSPVKSLGLQIGYLKTVTLSETFVDLGICITAPVKVIPETRAYIRGEGFLGDKFVELKPVKYIPEDDVKKKEGNTGARGPKNILQGVVHFLVPSAHAADPMPAEAAAVDPPPAEGVPIRSESAKSKGTKRTNRKNEIPVGEQSQDVQHLVKQVDTLVSEMSGLTNNLKLALNPEELRTTMRQLNQTLSNASRMVSPEGGLNTTAQRTLAKLEDAIEQLRDVMTRMNKGEGSVGMLLNDPSYAEEIRELIRNANSLLSRVGGVRFVVDLGAESIPAYDGTRGFFRLGVFPKRDRYYMLGVSVDPRGSKSTETTTTRTRTNGGAETVVVEEKEVVEKDKIVFTGMLGKIFWERLDLSLGIFHNEGTVSVGWHFGIPGYSDEFAFLRNDVYAHNGKIDDRVTLMVRPFNMAPFHALYVKGGIESVRKVGGELPWSIGGGVSFDDEDIKLIFTLIGLGT